jgi:RNA polymerase sigma-70 factor, ECF subfamily
LAVQIEDVADLIVRCTRDDDQAQALFYTQYIEIIRRAVFRKLQSMSPDRALLGEIDDICNDIFTRIFADNCRALRTLRNPVSIRAWLVTLAKHYTVDYVRKWASRNLVNVEEVHEQQAVYGADSEAKAVANERDALLSRCLAALPDDECLVLTLFYIHGRKYVEIAAMTGRNINTVSAKIRRAKTKLRRLIEEQNYENPY